VCMLIMLDYRTPHLSLPDQLHEEVVRDNLSLLRCVMSIRP
jgi:hypothetical protein